MEQVHQVDDVFEVVEQSVVLTLPNLDEHLVRQADDASEAQNRDPDPIRVLSFTPQRLHKESNCCERVDHPRDQASSQDLLVVLLPKLDQQRLEQLSRVDLIVTCAFQHSREVHEGLPVCEEPGEIEQTDFNLSLRLLLFLDSFNVEDILNHVFHFFLSDELISPAHSDDWLHLWVPVGVHNSLGERRGHEAVLDQFNRVLGEVLNQFAKGRLVVAEVADRALCAPIRDGEQAGLDSRVLAENALLEHRANRDRVLLFHLFCPLFTVIFVQLSAFLSFDCAFLVFLLLVEEIRVDK